MPQQEHTRHSRLPPEVWASVVRALNGELVWGLEPEAVASYTAALSQLLLAPGATASCRRIVLNYHRDHALVAALCQPANAAHEESWASWMPQVLAVLRHAGLEQSDDGSMDLDDLAQVARLELARSLPEFRYESRLSTWAYGVIIRSARSELRARAAQKRAVRPESLELSGELEVLSQERDAPDTVAEAGLLFELVGAVLRSPVRDTVGHDVLDADGHPLALPVQIRHRVTRADLADHGSARGLAQVAAICYLAHIRAHGRLRHGGGDKHRSGDSRGGLLGRSSGVGGGSLDGGGLGRGKVRRGRRLGHWRRDDDLGDHLGHNLSHHLGDDTGGLGRLWGDLYGGDGGGLGAGADEDEYYPAEQHGQRTS